MEEMGFSEPLVTVDILHGVIYRTTY